MSITVKDFLRFNITPSDISSAAITATKKFINVDYTGFVSRSPMKMLDDFFRGDLAKSVFKEYLIKNGITAIVDYDDIRTDGFKNPRLREWHINATGKKIEINSSILPARWGINDIIEKGDIKITQNGFSPFELKYDIAIQMYYDSLSDYDTRKECKISSLSEVNADVLLPDILDAHSRYKNILGVAWASQDDIEKFRLENTKRGLKTTWTFPKSTRQYWMCKIAQCNPFATLPSNL